MGHLLECVFTHLWHATFCRKNAKGLVIIFKNEPRRTLFGDIQLIGRFQPYEQLDKHFYDYSNEYFYELTYKVLYKH